MVLGQLLQGALSDPWVTAVAPRRGQGCRRGMAWRRRGRPAATAGQQGRGQGRRRPAPSRPLSCRPSYGCGRSMVGLRAVTCPRGKKWAVPVACGAIERGQQASAPNGCMCQVDVYARTVWRCRTPFSCALGSRTVSVLLTTCPQHPPMQVSWSRPQRSPSPAALAPRHRPSTPAPALPVAYPATPPSPRRGSSTRCKPTTSSSTTPTTRTPSTTTTTTPGSCASPCARS